MGNAATTYAASHPVDAVAARVLSASRTRWYDPGLEIAWDEPLVPGMYFVPPEQVSLYGTPLWDRMPEQQRIDLSRHEASSIAQCGIWLELILDGLLLHLAHAYHPGEARFQYSLTEVADEVRHTVMFAALADKLETPRYGPGKLGSIVGLTVPKVVPRAEAFASMLVSEELLDAGQRASMKDERVQPFIRQVCQLHVTEEARHISYARSELARIVARMSAVRRDMLLGYLTGTGLFTLQNMINPRVYAEVGLDVREARRQVRHSAHRREMRKSWTTRFAPYLQDIGLLDGTGPWAIVWRKQGLVPAPRPRAVSASGD